MKYVFNFPLQLLFKMFFTLINFCHFMLKIHVETHLGCHAKCSLKFPTLMKMEIMWQFLYNSVIFFMEISPSVLEGVGNTLLCNIGIQYHNPKDYNLIFKQLLVISLKQGSQQNFLVISLNICSSLAFTLVLALARLAYKVSKYKFAWMFGKCWSIAISHCNSNEANNTQHFNLYISIMLGILHSLRYTWRI